jgi:hypothetical protein
MAHDDELQRLADACVARLPGDITIEALERAPAFQALLAAVRASDPRFAFEREGRPDAIAAIRAALPAVESDLFDAVVEDHACEVAALTEALRLLAQSVARSR